MFEVGHGQNGDIRGKRKPFDGNDCVHDLVVKQTHLCFHQQEEVLYWGQCLRTGPHTARSHHSLLGKYLPGQPQIHGSPGSPVVPEALLSLFGPPALPQPPLPSAPGACTPAAESLQEQVVVEQALVFWVVEPGLLEEGSSVLMSPVCSV